MIPREATAYALIEQSPLELVRRVTEAYLAARSESTQRRLRELWSQIETELDVDVERDLLMQLGPRIVIHDYPQHPLPLARTVVIQVTGSPAAVRTAVDRLMRRWQRHLESPQSGWPLLRLQKADDGVWYLQMGLYGPALAVTDRWLVISFSPVAVRQILALLEPPGQVGVPRP